MDAGDPGLGRGVHRVAGERALEGGEGLLVAVEGDERAAPVAPGLGGVGPQGEGAVEGDEGPLAELGRGEVVALQVEGRPEEHVGAGVAGVESDRALEEDDGAVDRLLALLLEVEEALRAGLVGLEALRLLGPRGGQLPPQPRHQLGDQPVLELEDRLAGPVDARVQGDAAGGGLGHAGGHADAVAQALVGAAHDAVGPHLAPHAHGEGGVVGVRREAHLAEHLEDPLAGDDREAGHLGEAGAHRLGEARPQPRVLRPARDVGEAGHRDACGRAPGRARGRSRRGARRGRAGPRACRQGDAPGPSRASARRAGRARRRAAPRRTGAAGSS